MQKGAQIGQGRTAEVYAWGGDRILKLYQDWMPTRAVEYEFTVTRGAGEAGLPVPAAEELVELDGRFGIVFERIQGPSLLKELETRPWKMSGVMRQMAELHARLHACSAPPEMPSLRAQLEDGIAAAAGLPEEAKQAILRRLSELPDGDRLCHGDFHPDNILLSERGPIVIDWLTAARGDPLADVSRTSLLFHTGGLPPHIPLLVQSLINASRSRMFEVYLRRYLRLHPAERRQIAAWDLPVTAARLPEVEGYPRERHMLLSRLDKLLSRQPGF
jgi:uncharacterized protein (TIGR02172 family)